MAGNPILKELQALAKTLKSLAGSQVGFEGRKLIEDLQKKTFEAMICAGPVHKPFDDVNYGKNQFALQQKAEEALQQAQNLLNEIKKDPKKFIDANQAPQFNRPVENKSLTDSPRLTNDLSLEEQQILIREAKKVGVDVAPRAPPIAPVAKNLDRHQTLYRPKLPKNYQMNLNVPNKNLSQSHERKVPSSRLARVYNFGTLAFGLGTGTAAEITRRTFGIKNENENVKSPFLTSANAERIVETLCRVRGAALKLGQMLSIQDDTLVPKFWLEIFDRVRHSADFMPFSQVQQQLVAELGENWRDLFTEFDEKPFAAASIGQVHRATALDGSKLAVKVQYPGVADGIDADIDNLVSILKMGGIFPKGMFLEEFVKVARRELKLECDYGREANSMIRMRDLLHHDDSYYVPGVFPNLSSKKVLTTEFIEGKPIDACLDEPQPVRDYIAAKFIELCLKEVFVFRFMQTDPNWSNFFFGRHPQTGEPRLVLLDFGAARDYPKKFVDTYMNILRSAYNNDREQMLQFSRDIGFLTGFEDKVMENAHCDSISILAETFVSTEPYDFRHQDVTQRIHKLVPVMLERRLTSPPEEIYSLHRKLSGAYLLATKLKAVVSCGPIFKEISDDYKFGEEDRAEAVANS